MAAPSRSAATAETKTASLVRTSSRKAVSLHGRLRPSRPPAVVIPAGRLLRQIREQLHLAPALGHRIKNETRDHEKKRQQHQAGREDRGRKARYHALLQEGGENRDRQNDRDDGKHDADTAEEGERPLGAA